MSKFHCIHCGQRIDAPAEMAGSESNCPACGGAIQVPDFVPVKPPPIPVGSSGLQQDFTNAVAMSQPEKGVSDNFLARLTTFKGRIGRMEYFRCWLLKVGLVILCGVVSIASKSDLVMVLVVVLFLCVAWINFSLLARRLHDTGVSAWILLLYPLAALPVVGALVGLIFTIYCFAVKGDSGPNKFGTRPCRIFRSAQ